MTTAIPGHIHQRKPLVHHRVTATKASPQMNLAGATSTDQSPIVMEPIVPSVLSVLNLSNLRKVWFINLDSQPVRREQLERSLMAGKSSVPFERFSAVSVSSLQDATSDPRIKGLAQRISSFETKYAEMSWSDPSRPLSPLSRFVISVFLSHLAIYDQANKEFVFDKRGYILVLEDDVKVTPEFEPKLENLMKQAPPDWQVRFIFSLSLSLSPSLSFT